MTFCAPYLLAELADGLEEGKTLDIAHRAADLGDDHVDVRVTGDPCDALLDLIGDMGDHLHRTPEVVALALLADDVVVDGTRRHIGVAGEVLVDEALIVTQVEVGLRAVFGHEDLPVLERAHRPGIDIEIGIELLDDDFETTALQKATERGSGDAFSKR